MAWCQRYDHMCAGLKDAVQSTESRAGSQRPSVQGTSENVQEGIDSAADAVKAGSRRAEQYAAEPEKVMPSPQRTALLCCLRRSPCMAAPPGPACSDADATIQSRLCVLQPDHLIGTLSANSLCQ